MLPTKVIYKDGNNQKFDYYIVAERKEIIIDKTSLAYKIDPTEEKSHLVQLGGIVGNFDLILRMTTKVNIFKAHVFCSYDDIEKI